MPDRRDVNQLLEEMDDVVTDWEGSRDAMRWRPDSTPDASGNASFAADVSRFVEGMANAVRSLSEVFSTPGWQAFLAAAKAGELQRHGSCHCLCIFNHPGESKCLGEVPETELRTVRFGEVDVPMCVPCAGEESDDA